MDRVGTTMVQVSSCSSGSLYFANRDKKVLENPPRVRPKKVTKLGKLLARAGATNGDIVENTREDWMGNTHSVLICNIGKEVRSPGNLIVHKVLS